jgi:hypothetical protein
MHLELLVRDAGEEGEDEVLLLQPLRPLDPEVLCHV